MSPLYTVSNLCQGIPTTFFIKIFLIFWRSASLIYLSLSVEKEMKITTKPIFLDGKLWKF